MTSSRIPGGRGAWIFIVPLLLLMTAGTFYFAFQYKNSDQQKIELFHQEELHTQEIQSLRSQVDKLQSELAEVGSIAQQKEVQLRQKEATLETVKTASEQKETEEKILAQKKELMVLEHQKKLTQKLKTPLEAKEVTIRREQAKIILTFPNQILFDAGSDAVKTEATSMLTVIGNYIQDLPSEVETRISAHQDNTPLQGTLAQKYPSVLELTAIRAASVARTLTKMTNLSPKRILSVGMGDTQPLYPNDDPQKKLLNRRVEIVFDLTPSFQESTNKK
ncbi:MAG: OmpA family protein [Verrucomicrobiota bacterium]